MEEHKIQKNIETLEARIERYADIFRGNEDELARLRHGAGPSSYDRIAELMEENEGISLRIEEMSKEIEKLGKSAELMASIYEFDEKQFDEMEREIQNALAAQKAQIIEVQKMLKVGENPTNEKIITKVKELCLIIEDELDSEYIVAPKWDDMGFPYMIFEKAEGFGHRDLDSRRENRRDDLTIMDMNDDMGLVYVDLVELELAGE